MSEIRADIQSTDKGEVFAFSAFIGGLPDYESVCHLSLSFEPSLRLPNEPQQLFNLLRLIRSPVELFVARKSDTNEIWILSLGTNLLQKDLNGPSLRFYFQSLKLAHFGVLGVFNGECDDLWNFDWCQF